jgi:hypothetical protein
MKEKIDELNEKELAWIKDQINLASSFVEKFAQPDKGYPPSLASLDRAFAAWIETEPVDGEVINGVINRIGIAFGSHLVEGLGFKWIIATDDQGSDLAVYALPGRGDVLVYPANFVAKRWERREVYFLERSYQLIAQDMRKVSET